jgi:hypothetical protein
MPKTQVAADTVDMDKKDSCVKVQEGRRAGQPYAQLHRFDPLQSQISLDTCDLILIDTGFKKVFNTR